MRLRRRKPPPEPRDVVSLIGYRPLPGRLERYAVFDDAELAALLVPYGWVKRPPYVAQLPTRRLADELFAVAAQRGILLEEYRDG